MKRFSSLDGRWIVLLFLLGYLLVLLVGKAAFHRSYTTTLMDLGVPAIAPHFIDLHFVVACCESLHAGYDPTRDNPFDGPTNRPFNYPPWWLHAESVGLNEHTYRPVAYLMILAFLVTSFHLIGRISIRGGIYLGLFLVSPAVVLCMERGNIDLLMFLLVASSFYLRRHLFAAIPLLVFAAMLKLFPIFALPAFAAPPWKKALAWLLGAGFVFLAYLHFYARELAAVSRNTGRLIYHSFGTMVVRIRFSDWYHFISIHAKWIDFGCTLFFGLLLLAALRWKPRLELSTQSPRELTAFRLGAFLFLGIFAIGTSYDYKLIFLLFCLPWLFHLSVGKAPINHWAQACLLCSLIYAHWFSFSGEDGFFNFLIRQSFAWAVAGSLGVLLATTQQWPAGSDFSRGSRPNPGP